MNTGVSLILTATPDESLQSLVDGLASNGGGTLLLEAGRTYTNVSLRLPWDSTQRYQNIRIIGHRSRLVGNSGPILHVGEGCPDYKLPKLQGVELHGLDFDIQGDGVTIQQTVGALVSDCTFNGSAREALITGGADSTTSTIVRNCHALDCGNRWEAGPLAAFNMNCLDGRLEYSTATLCGLFGEFGGNGTRITHCHADNSPVKIGSGSFGVSNIEISNSRFEESYIECENPLGRMADIRIVHCTLRNSPFCWGGAADKDNVTIPAMPFSDRPSLFASNLVMGHEQNWSNQGVRLTAHKLKPTPLCVIDNTFDCPDGQAVISQGIPGPVAFSANRWPKNWHTVYRHLPDGTKLEDPKPFWRID